MFFTSVGMVMTSYNPGTCSFSKIMQFLMIFVFEDFFTAQSEHCEETSLLYCVILKVSCFMQKLT